MLRATLAVIAGFILWSILWLGGNIAIGVLRPESQPEVGPITDAPMMIMMLGLSVVCSATSGWLAAFIGRARGPAVILAILLLVVGIGVQAPIWDRMPLWYHLPFLILLVPACLAGARVAPARVAPPRS